MAVLDAERAILDRLPVKSEDALDLEGLRLIEPSIGRTVAKAAIKSLVATSRATRLGSGKRGDPHRFFSAMNLVSTHTPRCDQQPETHSRVNGKSFHFDGVPV